MLIEGMSELSPMIQAQIGKLTEDQQLFFMSEYSRKKKASMTTRLLAIIGLHYLYLSRWGLFVLYFFTGGGFFIWWIIDIFRASNLAAQKNNDIAMDALMMTKAISH